MCITPCVYFNENDESTKLLTENDFGRKGPVVVSTPRGSSLVQSSLRRSLDLQKKYRPS